MADPEAAVSSGSRGLMGSVGVEEHVSEPGLSVVLSEGFAVLWRSTKAGPSAPISSPPSSLEKTAQTATKTWTGIDPKCRRHLNPDETKKVD